MNGNWRHNAVGLEDEKQREAHLGKDWFSASSSKGLNGAQGRRAKRLS